MRTTLLFAVALVALTSSCSESSSFSSPRRDAGTKVLRGSWKEDVVPIFRDASCALTGCHGAKGNNRGIYLTGDPAQMRDELMKESSLAKGMRFVVPGDPVNSWLMIKLDGRQKEFSAKCRDASGQLPAGDCGQAMPQNDDPSVVVMSVEDREFVRTWIENGAKYD